MPVEIKQGAEIEDAEHDEHDEEQPGRAVESGSS